MSRGPFRRLDVSEFIEEAKSVGKQPRDLAETRVRLHSRIQPGEGLLSCAKQRERQVATSHGMMNP